MKAKKLKILAFMSFVLSLLWVAYEIYYNINFSFDLISKLYFYTGIFCLIFTFLSTFFALFKFKKTKNYPRLFGIYAGIWALAHFFVYFVFSKNLNLFKLWDDISKRIFETSGFIAFVIMFFMFLSSFKALKKIEKIRKLGYLCLFIATYHYFLSAKVPQIEHYLALILAFSFFVWRYLRTFLKIKNSSLKKTELAKKF